LIKSVIHQVLAGRPWVAASTDSRPRGPFHRVFESITAKETHGRLQSGVGHPLGPHIGGLCTHPPRVRCIPGVTLILVEFHMELFVEFFTLSWAVEGWNLSFMSLLHRLFLKSIGENTILWFLNIRHSGTLFGMWFPTSAQQMLLLILPFKS
jgi:hypothetical protein